MPYNSMSSFFSGRAFEHSHRYTLTDVDSAIINIARGNVFFFFTRLLGDDRVVDVCVCSQHSDEHTRNALRYRFVLLSMDKTLAVNTHIHTNAHTHEHTFGYFDHCFSRLSHTAVYSYVGRNIRLRHHQFFFCKHRRSRNGEYDVKSCCWMRYYCCQISPLFCMLLPLSPSSLARIAVHYLHYSYVCIFC